MQLRKTKDTRWITPFEATFAEFQVQMRRLPSDEVMDINSKHGLRIGARDGTPIEKSWRATRDIVIASIVDWRGYKDAEDKPVPCTPEEKLQLADMSVIDETEPDLEKQRKPMYAVLIGCLEKAEDVERKN
jgi:hypothetical protein